MLSPIWRPILSGGERDRAMDVAMEIGTTLYDQGVDPAQPNANAEAALFLAYLSQVMKDPEVENTALLYLDTAIKGVAHARMTPSLFGGFTGVAWSMGQIREIKPKSVSADSTSRVDEALTAYLSHRPWSDHYDLISGLTGIGIYAIEQYPRGGSAKCIEYIVGHLDDLAQVQPDGIAWLTSPQFLSAELQAENPEGVFDTGAAHGIAGVISFIAQAYELGLQRAKCRRLLDGAVNWLLKRRLSKTSDSAFPNWISGGLDDVRGARSAWCYGDPGISLAVITAALSVEQRTWLAEAVGVARQAARRSEARTGVVDAGICHGAAGLGHIYNRIFQLTGDETVGEAACRWLNIAIDMRQPKRGIAGYSTFDMDMYGQVNWIDDSGFLTGVAGIGLVLLAACAPLEPRWDHILLAPNIKYR